MDWTPLIHALIAIAAQLLVGLLTGNWWLGGAGFLGSHKRQCVTQSTDDRLTSNMGFGLNLYQSPSRRVDVDMTWTHHSCVFGSDRNSYDGLGIKVVWRPWVR